MRFKDEKLCFVNQNQCDIRIFTSLNYAEPCSTTCAMNWFQTFQVYLSFSGSDVLVNKLLLNLLSTILLGCGCLNYRNVDFADSCTYDTDKGFGVCDSCKFHSEGDKCDSCVTNYYVNPVVSNSNLTYPDGEQCQGNQLVTNWHKNILSFLYWLI